MTKILSSQDAAQIASMLETIVCNHEQMKWPNTVTTKFVVDTCFEVEVLSWEMGTKQMVYINYLSEDEYYYSLTEFRDAYDLPTTFPKTIEMPVVKG